MKDTLLDKVLLSAGAKTTEEANSIYDLARKNRRTQTEAESIMWELLRGGFHGVRFRRQEPIAGYIADFACLPKKLVVEIDGRYHFTPEQIEADRLRTKTLHDHGYTVMRFTNEEVVGNTDNVIIKIKDFIIRELL